MSNSIILFSNNCPKCQILKKKLEQKGILYEVSEDFEVLLNNNIETIPVLSVDGKLMEFKDATIWVNNHGDEH